MEKLAKEFYEKGYSCSESILKAAAVKGILSEEMVKIATAFSGGMSSGCLCGAIAGAQLVISSKFGRTDNTENPTECKAKAKEFIDAFKAQHKVTCCKALSGKYDFNSPERRQNCSNLVEDCAKILTGIMKAESKV